MAILSGVLAHIHENNPQKLERQSLGTTCLTKGDRQYFRDHHNLFVCKIDDREQFTEERFTLC